MTTVKGENYREDTERELLALLASDRELSGLAEEMGLESDQFKTPGYSELWRHILSDKQPSCTRVQAIVGKPQSSLLTSSTLAEWRVFELLDSLGVTEEEQETPARPSPSAAPAPQHPFVTGKLATLRRNRRSGDVNAIYFYGHRHDGKTYRSSFRHSALFVAWLHDRLGNRDPGDRELVSSAELGKVLNLGFAEILEIERKKTEYRRGEDQQRGRHPRRPYCVTTIAPCDMSAAEVTRQRRKNRARTNRAVKITTEQEMQTQQHGLTRAVLMAAAIAQQTANTEAEKIALWEAIGPADSTIAKLIPVIRRLPSRRDFGREKLRQLIADRLDAMEAEDPPRVATVRYDQGPRGSKIRVIRRVFANKK